jgi:alpha-glucosidase (family GH31 glycosyl hydrolase)
MQTAVHGENFMIRRGWCLRFALVLALFAGHGAALLASTDISESADKISVSTQTYRLEIARDGYELKLLRGKTVVFQSAGKDSPMPSLGFQSGQKAQHLTRLKSVHKDGDQLTLTYDTTATDVTARVVIQPEADRIRFHIWILNSDAPYAPNVSFRLTPGQWYGGAFLGYKESHTYPLNEARLSSRLFYAQGASQGTPIWYSTCGVGLWVRTPHDFSYSISRNAQTAELSLEMDGVSELSYDLLVAQDVRELLQKVNREIGWPRTAPPQEYMQLPVYTTWVESKTAVSQQSVIAFARSIREHKLPAGAIEIDDKWEDGYGDLRFDAKKFPDPKAMNDELHRLGFRVTLWVHPFVDTDAHAFTDPATTKYLLKDLSGNVGLIQWWQGTGAVWDFSNPEAAAEFRNRLEALQSRYGFDGFKFDGGDVNLVPADLQAAAHISAAEFPDIYDREIVAHFPWSEARVGSYAQSSGVVQRLIDKDSVWGTDNGLASVVPEAILNSMRGFVYVMPDMVGGNQYHDDKIDSEMLVRWAQMSTLMPFTQFSLGPWHFDAETLGLCREASQLRAKFFPYIWKLAEDAPKTGEPILRPIWYNFPAERAADSVMDEFMLGTAVLVAPVVQKGANKRDIYLPPGQWRDYNTGKPIAGGRVLRDYPAPLSVLPIFIEDGAHLDLNSHKTDAPD